MARQFAWDVTLTIRGPILTTSSAPMEFGIDAPFARNAAGEYYLAGTLVKGRLKEAWRELYEMGLGTWDWKTWIGPEPPGEQDWASSRGLLQFTDFLYAGKDVDVIGGKTKIIYRIERDDETATVKRGQNQMMQTPFLAGGEYPFKGRIWAIASDETATALDDGLPQGLCWVPGIGADTSVGFGVISNVVITRSSEYLHGSGWDDAAEAESWSVAITPEGPLCVGRKRIAENIFQSEAQIPGGVLKGAIADSILRLHGSKEKDVSRLAGETGCAMKELCEEFSKIRVLHAKPVKNGSIDRPREIPASTVKVGTPSALKDLALANCIPSEVAPAFRIDWKSSKDAEVEFGITRVQHELRVRTQMDCEKRRAKGEHLFAYRMVVPRARTSQASIDEYEWLTAISFAQISDPHTKEAVQSQLADLLADVGIPGVGKLKTRCVASRVGTSPFKLGATQKGNREPSRWVITLQTPALLCDVGALAPGMRDASAAYKNYWEEASGRTLTLERHFARQTLTGGEFIWKRFAAQSPYCPFVLTDAGAVFVLQLMDRVDPGKATKKIEMWKTNGLPIAETVCKRFGLAGDASDWKKCPYVPENGFGEIAVDLEWHWKEAQA